MSSSTRHGVHRLVVLSGPSCAGKSPLKHALRQRFPQLFERMKVPVLYNSRAPRPGEEDGKEYHFRTRRAVEDLREKDGYLVVEARSDLQAVNLSEISTMLQEGDVFYEGNVHVALELMRSVRLGSHELVDVFLSPLSSDEVHDLLNDHLDFEAAVTALMRNRLMRRLLSKKPFATLPDLQDIEVRARAAPHALRHAHQFSHVIVNHDGEDSDHWGLLGRPLGDARAAVSTLARLLCGSSLGEAPVGQLETWRREMLGAPDCEAAGSSASR